jgi:hypothetical protein
MLPSVMLAAYPGTTATKRAGPAAVAPVAESFVARFFG